MSDDRSSNLILRPVAAERKAKRFTLDYVTWRTHLAAPGSRFEPAQTAERRLIRLDPPGDTAASLEMEKRTA
jgi:hypothetical protein